MFPGLSFTITSTFTTPVSVLSASDPDDGRIAAFNGNAVCPGTTPGHTASRAAGNSADAERLTHLTKAGLLTLLAEAGLLAERLLAEAAAPLLLALTLLTLLAVLQQRQDRGRQCLLNRLLHSTAHALDQRRVQRDSQVRVRLLLQTLLLQLLLHLLDLLQRLLHTLRDLLTRLLTRLLDGLLDDLRELLLRPARLLPELLQRLGPGHHRHEGSFDATEDQHKG
ncbi:hypothetical protein [Streptomyces sp. NBC_01614]|uniref:Uncharacterized protein n=1 Tax=Streptomyces sp. NBC_00180 TaxID=2903632 RepID=A0AAU1IA73_9ACTN